MALQKMSDGSSVRQKVDFGSKLRRVSESTSQLWQRADLINRLGKMISRIKFLWEKYDVTNKFRRIGKGIYLFLRKQKDSGINSLRKGYQWIKFFMRRVDGINVWRVSRIFTEVAHSRENLEERMFNGNLVIQLDHKNKRELIDTKKKQEIINEIRKLEGFEIFRLCLLEDCQIEYKESYTQFGVTRWLEIPVNLK